MRAIFTAYAAGWSMTKIAKAQNAAPGSADLTQKFFGGQRLPRVGGGPGCHRGDTLSPPAPCRQETRPPTAPGPAALTREFSGDAGPATGGGLTGTPDALSATRADPPRALWRMTGPTGARSADDHGRALR